MTRIGAGASNPYINQTEIAKPAEQKPQAAPQKDGVITRAAKSAAAGIAITTAVGTAATVATAAGGALLAATPIGWGLMAGGLAAAAWMSWSSK
jgi:FtsH-binding integral membrane protein